MVLVANRSRFAVLMLVALLPLGAVEHQMPNGYSPAEEIHTLPLPLPTDLATSLEIPAEPQFLGSAWVVRYVIHNHGTSEFTWFHGGDSHAPRRVRVWLEAVGPDGVLASDPLGHTLVFNMGGFGGETPVEPRGTSYITVNPRLFTRIDRPGRWTLRMFHDLGMGPTRGDADPRWATATIDLVMPDERQAKLILDEHERRLSLDPTETVRERPSPRADFSAMAFRVFLPLLEARARQGWSAAIEGIAAMPTVEATDLLLALGLLDQPLAWPELQHAYQPPVPQLAALRALAQRLQPPTNDLLWHGTGDPFLLPAMPRDRIGNVAACAKKLGQHRDPAIRKAAAVLLACAEPDPQDLLQLIDQEAMRSDGEAVLHPLLSAFHASGASVPAPQTSAAAALLWLNRSPRSSRSRERPVGWEDVVAELLAHPAPRVRQAALRIVPWDSPRHWSPDLERLLHDTDAGVRSQALRSTERYRDAALIPAMSFAFAHEAHLHRAAETIRELGGRFAEARAWIGHLESSPHPSAVSTAMHGLSSALTNLRINSPWSAAGQPDMDSRRTLAARWRDFLAVKRDALARGPLVPDESWPTDLLPAGWSITLDNGKSWPTAPR